MPRVCKITIFLSIVIFVFSLVVIAENKLEQWRGSAEIAQTGTTHRYTAFYLTEQIYEHSRPDLADLRIVDQNYEFVPYVVINGYNTTEESQTIYNSQLIKQFKKKGNTFFDFQLIPLLKNADITGNQLKLTLPAQNFLINIDIYGSYDGNTWEKFSNDQLYRVDDLVKEQIVFSAIEKFTYYRIVILNNINNLQLQNLQLINKNIKSDWSGFQKTSQLDYKVTAESGDTIVTINNPQHLKVKRLVITATGNFRRAYQVFDTPGMDHLIKTGDIYNLKFQDLNITETAIDLADNPCSSPKIKLKIINHDNRPLSISNIQTEFYLDQIVFEDSGNQDYRLYFGNPEARPPVYDLESFKSHILKEPMNSANLGELVIKPKVVSPKSKLNLSLIFNIVITAIALLLIIFLVKKLNSPKN
jgi:hypothetical protein